MRSGVPRFIAGGCAGDGPAAAGGATCVGAAPGAIVVCSPRGEVKSSVAPPMRMDAPSASGVGLKMRLPSTQVPLTLPRSSIW